MDGNIGLYTKTCRKCKGMFVTDKPRAILCTLCKSKKKKNRTRNKRITIDIPLRELTAVIENYNREHKTQYTYGKFVELVKSGMIKLERY